MILTIFINLTRKNVGLDDVCLVSSIKVFIQNFIDDRWDDLLPLWNNLCETRNINVPNMNVRYVERSRKIIKKIIL